MSEWKMVPALGTQSMWDSANKLDEHTDGADWNNVWRALLDGAPTPPAPQPMTNSEIRDHWIDLVPFDVETSNWPDVLAFARALLAVQEVK